MTTFKDFLTVREAAQFLGISVMTLHRWDASGKLKALRHPINHYRLYRQSDLELLLKQVAPGKKLKKKKKTS